MRQRIENRILITCEDLDLTTLTDMEIYIEQLEADGKANGSWNT